MDIVNVTDEVNFRVALAEGFLTEAEQDIELERWRSCVDNSQLAIENAGKAVLALFQVPSKTHEPAQQIALILKEQKLPENIHRVVQEMLPDLLTFGKREHFLTDYGDETTYTLPWDLFNRDSAESAVEVASRSLKMAKNVVELVVQWRNLDHS